MKKILQNLTIVAASIVVSLGVCEVVARIMLPPPMAVKVTTTKKMVAGNNPQKDVEGPNGDINSVIDWSGKYGVRLFPNVTGHIHNHTLSKQDVVIRVNSIGLRGGEVPPRHPGQYRILMMGDSITFGDYVDETLTISAYLEKELKSRGVPDVVVMNAGLPGVNLAEEFHHYQEIYEAADPDLVLLGMYLNDAQEAQKFYAKTLRFPFSQSRFLTWVVRQIPQVNSDALFRRVRLPTTEADWKEKFRNGRDLHSGDTVRTKDGFDFEIYNASRDFGLAWNPVAWEQLTKISTAFAALVRQNKSKFAAFMFPVAIQIWAQPQALDTYPQKRFDELFTKLDVPHMDLLPPLQVKGTQMTRQELLYDHCHYKAEGNQFVAATIADWLVKEPLVPVVK